MQEDTFYPRQEYEQVNFYKKSCLYIVGRSVGDGKVKILFNDPFLPIYQLGRT